MRRRQLLLGLVATVTFLACQATTLSSPFGTPLVGHVPAASPVDVEHYRIELALVPELERVEGRCRIEFGLASDGPGELDRVTFDLFGLEVERVHDGEGSGLEFVHRDGRLAVELGRTLARGERSAIEVVYGGSPEKGLWFTGDRAGVPTQVFTQGECEDARWWFPCQDFPSDRASSEVVVRMPLGWTSVAAGELVSRTEEGEERVDHWRMAFPHPTYLVTLVAGEFDVLRDEWNGIPLLFLARAELAPLVEHSLADTGPALDFLAETTDEPYPYSKYSQACVDGFPFGGMENISATTLTEWTLKDELGRRDEPSTGLVVHEAAHQWFGDLLTCSDWSHIWLNEGFATYFTLAYFERTLGREEFLARYRDTLDEYLASDVGERRRPIVHDVYRDPVDLFFGGHTYEGGASRLHLLRHVLGDEDFWRGIQRYVDQGRGRGVHTDDLRRALEEVSGRDLTQHFDQWLYSPGYPEFVCSWSYEGPDEGPGEVELSIRQTQEARGGTPAAFEVPMDVELAFEADPQSPGKDRLVRRIGIDRRDVTVRLSVPARPRWVRFDKYCGIPARFDRRKELAEWLRLAAEDDDVNGRRTAVTALVQALSGSSDAEVAAIEAVIRRVLQEDASRHVRKAAAIALTKFIAPGYAGSAETRRLLLRAASEDEAASVREASLLALESFGEDEELADFARATFDAPYSWRVAGAAASLFSTAAPEEAFEWLRSKLALPSPHGTLRGALLEELFQADDRRALPLLRREASDKARPDLSRIAAVRLLGRVDRDLANVQEDLLDLLGDEDFQVRRVALEALEELDDPRARGGLESYYDDSVFPRERRVIERMLHAFSVAN